MIIFDVSELKLIPNEIKEFQKIDMNLDLFDFPNQKAKLWFNYCAAKLGFKVKGGRD